MNFSHAFLIFDASYFIWLVVDGKIMVFFYNDFALFPYFYFLKIRNCLFFWVIFLLMMYDFSGSLFLGFLFR